MKKIYLLMCTLLSIHCIVFSQRTNDNPSVADVQTEPIEWNFNKYRLGGYGEVLFQQMNYGPNRYQDPAGAPSDNRSYITLPRAIFAFDYKFRNDIVFSTELEIEYGGTGAAMELEYEEAGEYEMEVEKGGEVVLEQFHFTKRFSDAFNVRIGHMIVPVGLTNAHHEPIFFFTTIRPEGETAMLPCTWHETGISFLGYFKKIRYEAMLVNGLDPNGFSTAYWVGSGKQGVFEQTVFTNPALAGRVEYSGVKNLRLSASGYYGNTTGNASNPNVMKGYKGTVSIASADAQYLSKNIIARANFIYGNLSDSKRISSINRRIPKTTGFSRTEVAQNAMTYSIEAGYNVFSFFNRKERLFPFVRYEYYDTMEGVLEGVHDSPIYQREIWTLGLNYFVLPNLVMKADYSMRKLDHGNYNDENTIGLSLAYTGWFIKK